LHTNITRLKRITHLRTRLVLSGHHLLAHQRPRGVGSGIGGFCGYFFDKGGKAFKAISLIVPMSLPINVSLPRHPFDVFLFHISKLQTQKPVKNIRMQTTASAPKIAVSIIVPTVCHTSGAGWMSGGTAGYGLTLRLSTTALS
jgi:hypothetical protein